MKIFKATRKKDWGYFIISVVSVIVPLVMGIIFFCILKHFNLFSDSSIPKDVYEVSYTINGEEKSCFAFVVQNKKEKITITTIDKKTIYIDLTTLDSEVISKNIGAKTAEEIQELKDSDE